MKETLLIELEDKEVALYKPDKDTLVICIDDDFIGSYAIAKINKSNLEKLKKFINDIQP